MALSRRDVEFLVNLDALTYSGQPMNLLDVQGNPRYTFVKGSITDAKLVSSILNKENISELLTSYNA